MKKGSFILLMIAAVCSLCACADSRVDRMETLFADGVSFGGAQKTEGKSAPGEWLEARAQTEEPSIEYDTTINDAVDMILENGTGDLFAGYPVDEGFLLDFAQTAGTEKLCALADMVENGTAGYDVWYDFTGKTLHTLMYEWRMSQGLLFDDAERCIMVDAASEDETVLAFTGDMNFDDTLGTMAKYTSYGLDAVIDPALQEVMRSVDIMMVNNECTFSDRGEPLAGKSFTFRSLPENASILSRLGVDAAGVANNHVWDYGEDALVDTIETLEKEGIPFVGAGHNIDEAMQPLYFLANGRKIAIVAATQIERTYSYTKQATDETAGVLKTLDPSLFTEVIRDADKNADYVIVFVHWGTETVSYIDDTQRELADVFVEAGADAIIGGHPHVLQGMEFVDGVPCMYSLGNFWFGSTPYDGVRKRDTGLLEVIVDKEGALMFRFLPCVQQEQSTMLITDAAEYQRILDYEKSISVQVDIDAEGYVYNLKDMED